MNKKNTIFEDDEIDLVELLKKVYKEKKLIFKYSIISIIVGVVLSLPTVGPMLVRALVAQDMLA